MAKKNKIEILCSMCDEYSEYIEYRGRYEYDRDEEIVLNRREVKGYFIVMGIIMVIVILVLGATIYEILPHSVSTPDGYVRVYEQYVVQDGDTLDGISKMICSSDEYNTDGYSWQSMEYEIAEYNKLDNINVIKNGQVIYFPQFKEIPEESEYTTKPKLWHFNQIQV